MMNLVNVHERSVQYEARPSRVRARTIGVRSFLDPIVDVCDQPGLSCQFTLEPFCARAHVLAPVKSKE
jgi:hypothetical protein